MKSILVALVTFISVHSYSQSKVDYLQQNRFDLTESNFDFPQRDFNIIGFGAYHGSAKTEAVEYKFLNSLAKNGIIEYYLPETDFNLGHFFNKYLQTGDTLLLKDLVFNYGARVPQERSIETYEKWKGIKNLNDKLPRKNRFSVVGIDQIVTYKYTAKHLLELLNSDKIQNDAVQELEQMIALDTTDYSPYYDSYSKSIMKAFVASYEANTALFSKSVNDEFALIILSKT